MADIFITKLASTGPLCPDDKVLLRKALGNVKTFRPRQEIIGEGDKPDNVLVMIDGWSCRYQVLRDGGRQITAFLIPGDTCDTHVTMFGAMDHSIATLTDCQVAFVPRDIMIELMERPNIARAMWWASLVDEAVLRAWIVNMGRRAALDRVAHLICELHARLRNAGLIQANEFDFPLNQEDLGDTLGITSVHVNRTLRTLRERDLMTFKNQRIHVTDMPGLQRLASFDPNYLHLNNAARQAD